MGFAVDVAGAGGLPDQLDRLRLDALRGSGYVGAHATVGHGGVLNTMWSAHERTVRDVRGYLEKLGGQVAGNTAEAARAALAYYRRTDATAAAALDASYPGGAGVDDGGTYGSTSFSSSARRPRFADVTQPSARYAPPPDRHDEYRDEPQVLDCISPAALGRGLIIDATELAASLGLGHRWDPYEAILQPLTGDWNGLRGCADVFDNVGAAVGDMAANLRAMADDVPEVWAGHAADGLTGYLLRVAGQLDGTRPAFADLAGAYEAAAETAHEDFQKLADILNALIDLVVIFVAEAALAAGTAETGVGAVVLGAGAAAEAWEMYKLIHDGVHLLEGIIAAIEKLVALLRGSGVHDSQLRLPALDAVHLRLPGDQSGVGRVTIGPAR